MTIVRQEAASSSAHAGLHGAPPRIRRERAERRTPCLGGREVHIWRVGLDVTGSAVEANFGMLTADETRRATRYRRPELRSRFVAGRAALRSILGGYLEVDPAKLGIHYGPYGKPCIDAAGSAGIAFNASRSGSVMLVAIGRVAALGIDIERIHADISIADLAAGFFSARERRAIESVPEEDAPLAIFRTWTRKEALVKAIGNGLSAPLHEIGVAPCSRTIESPATDDNAFAAARWHLYSLDILPGYACALAVSETAERLRIVHYRDPQSLSVMIGNFDVF